MKPICLLLCYWLAAAGLTGCLASGSGDPEPFVQAEPASVPQLPAAPVTQLTLSRVYKGLMIGTDGLLADGSLSQVLQYNQRLYELNEDNEVTEVPILNGTETYDLGGNIVLPQLEGLVPNDLMVLNERYVLLAVRKRDADGDNSNDYHNLFVDLTTGLTTAAPLGLNPEGNSGSLHITTQGRDYFPPDARWNDTEDLYVLDVDYDTLGLMESGEYIEEETEQVDHSVGVPDLSCNNESETEEDTTTDTTTTDTTTTDTTTDTTATDTTVTDTATQSSASCPTTTADDTTDTTTLSLTQPAPRQVRAADDTTKLPTAVFRVRLGADGTYSLDKVSAPGDRPALGQFVVSRSGIMIYRNEDGGDDSYRVLISGCEDVTGRLSTVLFLQNSTLMVADDRDGNSAIYEITQRGINQLLFSCNGNVIRQSFSGYTTGINALRMPSNATSIAPYEYEYPYLITNSCDTVRLYPRQDPESEVINPLPPIPGLPSQDPRTLRKSQYLQQQLYCLGYDANLLLQVQALDPTASGSFSLLGFDLSNWAPTFSTIHLLTPNHLIFTGQLRTRAGFRTIMLDDTGVETDVTETLGGLEVRQHVEITPPPLPTPTTP